MGENRFSGKPGKIDTDWITWKCLRFQWIF